MGKPRPIKLDPTGETNAVAAILLMLVALISLRPDRACLGLLGASRTFSVLRFYAQLLDI